MNNKTQILRRFQEDCYIVSYPVRPQESNLRLDQFLGLHLPSFSREFIKRKIAKKEIIILERESECRPSTKIKSGDRIEMHCYRNEVEDEFWRGEKIPFAPLKYIYESNDLLIISKPPFMATHPTGKHLFHCATVQIEKDRGVSTYGVHRLDRETSGLLLFPKNSTLASSLVKAFEFENIKKCYFFISHKKTPKKPFPFSAKERLESLSGRIETLCYDNDSSRGKEAHTDFYPLLENEYFIVGLAFPKTGRQHQIRAHAAFHGYPLLGDKIYDGGIELFGRFKDRVASQQDHDLMQIPRHALHALGIVFPLNGEMRWVMDHLPKDLLMWMQKNLGIKSRCLEKEVAEKVTHHFKDFKKL
ncbi:MAG: RluA family pseudouridine synthase [Bacteriovoracales bacterium]|nr:RluA family pseudouridine synthase [Bacteriovoracales bacterium]